MSDTEDQETSGVVVPEINTASSTAAIRSLGRRDVETIVLSEHRHPPGFDSKYCDQRVNAPNPRTELAAYEQALTSLARRPDVDTIIPFREIDVYALARNRDQLAAHVGTPWPTLETLQRVQDRMALAEAAESAGISIPETDTLSNWTAWEKRCIVKPRYTVHAPEYDDRFEAPTPETGSTQYLEPGNPPSVTALVDELAHEPIVQEFVPSTDEYGFFALYDHGTAVATFQHRQERGWQYAGGPSAYRESVDIPDLERAGLALLDELEWHGVAMVEFLHNPRTDEFELMEINPRFWSSLPFTIQAGVDFPYLTWRLATDRPLPPDPDYTVGIGGHLLWGELLHLHSILTDEYPLVEKPSFTSRLWEVASSIAREPRFDYLSVDDPGPFRRHLQNSLATVSRDYFPTGPTTRQINVLPGRRT